MKKQVIYETSGRAREYAQLAMNHYRGCDHGCKYCYAPMVTHNAAFSIKILHKVGLHVIILTKGGNRSLRDFDLLEPGDQYAATLTFVEDADSLKWEPGAALPGERINALMEAHRLGIQTWVSLEPIIYPSQTAKLIELSYSVTGHYKLGPWHYDPRASKIEWKLQGNLLKRLMDLLGAHYYFKADFLKEMEVGPEINTWDCENNKPIGG